jgi:hypothetical protein
MADNNFRRYRAEEPGAAADADYVANEFARDPLAELARLIGQSDPAADYNRSTSNSAELLEHVAPDTGGFERPADEHYPDPAYYDDAAHDGQPDQYNQSAHYDDPAYAEAPASVPEHDPGFATYEAAPELPAVAPAAHQLPALAPQDPDAEYAAEEQWQDYADGQSEPADDYEYGAGRARGLTIASMAVAVVGLIVVGSGSAFAYRAMFGGKLFPSLPPIIMASSEPSKIVPPAPSASASQPAATKPGGDQLVSREEQPVQVQPSNPPPPRVVSTVPVMPATSVLPPAPSLPVPQVMAPAAPSPAPAAPTASVPEPKKVHTVSIPAESGHARQALASNGRPIAAPASRPSGDGPLSLVPTTGATRTQVARAEGGGAPLATESTGSGSGGYTVQLTSQRTEAAAKAAYRSMRAKYPQELGGHEPIIRRADLGAKGTFYRAMVGPFASAEAAAEVCGKLKAAGGSCIVQRH